MTGPCRILPWDSNFFGARIARLDVPEASRAIFTEADGWCRREHVDCLYVLADASDPSVPCDDQPLDVRVTFEAPVPVPERGGPSGVRAAGAGDVDALRALAAVSHRDSRFYADARLAPRADRLYEIWIEQSVRGAAAIVLVPDEPAVTGYVTCLLDDGGAGQIGLLAVAAAARGRGLSRSLIGAALAWFGTRGAHVARVVTQGRNARARRAYEACGFRVARTQFWYHRWMTGMTPPPIRIPFNRASLAGDEMRWMADAVRAGHISGDGPFTRRCHAILEAALGAPRALLTTSCTHALEMAALLLAVGPGDEVILPSFTFVSTVNAFALRGATPVFADIRPDTLNIDPEHVAALVTDRTAAIVVVHYAGVACDMEAIGRLASARGIPVIEDNAHGLFGTFRGRPLGSFGVLSTLSFHETKNFTCGEGGAIVVNDPALVERAEIIREKGTNRSRFFRGQVDKYTWVDLGSSYLPSDMLAAFLLAQLEARDRVQARRRAIWNRYAAELSGWARGAGARLPYIPEDCGQTWHMFYLLMPDLASRQGLIAHLKAGGIMAVFHYLPLHLSDMGRRFGGAPGQCPVTERVSDELVRLPMYASLSDAEQTEVVEAITSFSCATAGRS